jgi:predicted metalloprotease with PDZ domain
MDTIMDSFYGEEQAMRRMFLGTILLIIVLALRLLEADRAAAQETLPAPGSDGAGLESELPPPPQALDNSQQARDFSQAYLGVTFDPSIRDAAVARSVTAGSPADAAGLRAGDTIKTLNGRRIGSHDEVLRTINALRPGDVLDIDVSRRVSMNMRAVLDGKPLDGRRTTGYRIEAEPLPLPADFREPPPRPNSPQYNRNTPRQRPNYSAPENRRGNLNRNARPTERGRGYENRGLFRRG